MQTELEEIRTKFTLTASALAELFKVILRTSNEKFEKGKSDAYFELLSFCQAHRDSDDKVNKAVLQAFLEEKIKELQNKESK